MRLPSCGTNSRDMAMSFDDLPQALEWLDSHIDFEASMPQRRALPTLDRMRELTDLLGDPQAAYPALHITGTNGKGSTAAMVTALLAEQGLTVGTYTSPNLSRVNERIARNGQPIDDESFVEVLASLSRLETLMKDRPTRFELLTAAAFAWFADEAVDVAVIEVGLGGSWDSTNVVDADVAVLTNISYDHTDVLGPTLEDIARDKSGIIKPGSRVVIGETDPTLLDLIRTAAAAAGASQVWVRDEDFACVGNRLAVGGRLIDVRTPGAEYREVLLPLHGAHQGDNAACALAAAEAFFGAPLEEAVVDSAFAGLEVPGRLEVVGRHPLVIVDGAHNVAGMRALADALVEEFGTAGGSTAVVGMLSGRDPVAMLEPLRDTGFGFLVACAPHSPRALPSEVVAEAGTGLGMEVVDARTPAEAVALALRRAGADDRIVVCGSLYVVSDARELLVGNVA
ncbi:MAG: folylpolyglutamate synthase/dihydrofolate synthase family protein [Acidimicrobiales bacterium]